MRILLIALLSLPLLAQAQESPAGRWKTIDDATGKTKSIVEIHQTRDGSFAGRVAEILDTKDGPNPACDKCKGALHGKPIKGMAILWGLKPDGKGKWSGGTVLDPENGKTYKSKLELLDGGRKLGMSGCIAFFCRQQVWVKQ
ncbi:DUF2147 domain-containing protein [Thermomonas sp. HDW16]|uniref:DUF2147 domain-containing protein n=1 Tax=Thermomonas sp. HDW16 TaxID=2714945 RepID=UPI00140AC720|nr:DUF2147 domain-containing protein [Thermomonas sp. HDW16]QIL20416.1 DUF2147 domain-containing protein [Thermomonas sp. HDW16]